MTLSDNIQWFEVVPCYITRRYTSVEELRAAQTSEKEVVVAAVHFD